MNVVIKYYLKYQEIKMLKRTIKILTVIYL